MPSEVDQANALIDELVQARSPHTPGAPHVQTPASPIEYQLLNSAALAALQPAPWLVRGLLPASGLAAVFGPSASGKSFLTLDLCLALAEGRQWFGHRTRAAFVVYASLEGQLGMRQRVRAWEAHHGRAMPDTMRFVLQPFTLTSILDVEGLAESMLAEGGEGGVLVLDTLNRAAPTADENSSKDMGEILERAKRFQEKTGGLVILVHHTGKDSSKGMRGHSSLFAALDAVIEVSRDGDRRKWSLAKSKDAEDGEARVFKLAVVELGTDEIGDPLTSCVVTSDTAVEEIRQVRLPKGGNQKIVLDALRPLFKEGRIGRPGAPPYKRSIELDAAIIEAASRLTCDKDRRTERARDAITRLVSGGVMGCQEGWLWLA